MYAVRATQVQGQFGGPRDAAFKGYALQTTQHNVPRREHPLLPEREHAESRRRGPEKGCEERLSSLRGPGRRTPRSPGSELASLLQAGVSLGKPGNSHGAGP